MAPRLALILPLLCLVCIAAAYFPGHPLPAVRRVKRGAIKCDENARYRTADSTCNNLKRPEWGSTNQAYSRILKDAYDDDNVPRMTSKSKSELPAPRLISTRIHKPGNKPMTRGSAMLMEWGQFLAHDVAATQSDKDSDACCSDIQKLVIEGIPHSDIKKGRSCFPLIIPEGDRYFTTNETRCMKFIRSARDKDDKGKMQQINTISAFVDAGMVYGSSDKAMKGLRSFKGGKLLVKGDDLLPKSTENSCITEDGSDDYCMEAGDFRVNAFPGLGAMHTVFVRYHNYLADELALVNTTYDDEKLFQEARRINSAVLQQITYNEYLPLVIGKKAMKTYGLTADYVYDKSCDPSITNAFATAAFRFGHSMVPDFLEFNSKKNPIKDLFDRPGPVLNHLDSLVGGLVKNKGQKADRYFSTGMTDHLFETQPQHGFDIVSRNIQRGRDHGLPPYNEYRKSCKFDKLENFRKLPLAYEKVYKSVDDIDLYSGGISERPVRGGVVGETFACLIGKQFASLRNCDRFFYENTGDTVDGFTGKQIKLIKRTKLSNVLCRTGTVKRVQKNAFQVPDKDRNQIVDCSKHQSDLKVGFF